MTHPTSESPLKSKGGLQRISNAIRYSLAGLSSAIKHEAAFRQELFFVAILAPIPFFMPLSMMARAIMLGSLLWVLIVELMNSAIEAIVDRVSLERHPLSKRAKDLASAAVMLSIVNVVLVWGFILLDAL